MDKRNLGQYYTTHNPFDHPAFHEWSKRVSLFEKTILEPFAGSNNLIDMLKEKKKDTKTVSYDIEPGRDDVCFRDTLKDFPKGFEVVVSNPPYLAKNSAKRRGLKFPDTVHDDLYKFSLETILKNVPNVVAIVPDSFMTSGIFLNRCTDLVSLNVEMFEDTEHPVCLSFFVSEGGNPRMWVGDRLIGRYDDLRSGVSFGSERGHISREWRFNDPDGILGLHALDSTSGRSIRFVRGSEIPHNVVKVSSRSLTRISCLDLCEDRLEAVVNRSNEILETHRDQTCDVFLTSFKGLRKDGMYRKRLDFRTARHILNQAMFETE